MQTVRLISKSRQGVAAVSRVFQSLHSAAFSSGITYGNVSGTTLRCPESVLGIRSFSTEQALAENTSIGAKSLYDKMFNSVAKTRTAENTSIGAKSLYDKMFNSVAKTRTAPPNAWLWSLIANCSTTEDIDLLFDILTKLRVFRLSNLRLEGNFNSALSMAVVKACVRTGAIDHAKKGLWKNNLIGLTPEVGSANHLLLHAKQHGDVNLMIEIMKLMKENDLPLQPGTADIVFSICSSANRWDLISKYGKRCVTSGVKLRPTSFEIWMEFAAKRGDVESLWKIEKWRVEAMKKHSLSTGFSCAKGFLLDHKPEKAAAIIQELSQSVSDARRPNIEVELQTLASEWPLELIKQQSEDNKQAFAGTLQADISDMINLLSSLGVEVNVIVEDLISKIKVSS